MAGTVFYVACGVWALAMLALFIQAVRLSYRIEERSPDLRNRTGLPRYAGIPFTATNWRVARDDETQTLRRRMLRHLGVVALGFVLFWLFLLMIGAA